MNPECEQGHDWHPSQVKDISYCVREHCPAIQDDKNPMAVVAYPQVTEVLINPPEDFVQVAALVTAECGVAVRVEGIELVYSVKGLSQEKINKINDRIWAELKRLMQEHRQEGGTR
jgi:uncharacterized protein YjaZ